MSDMPWVRFFPSDWLGGTRGMSAAETGIYITLVASMYERGEPVPEDAARLARLCGASNSAFKAALETLIREGKIQRVEGGLWNERVEKESVYRQEKSEVGRQAADARWSKKHNKNNHGTDANALPTHSERNANQKPEPEREDLRTKPPKKRHSYTPEFEEFWKAYPTDPIMSKAEAFKAFEHLTDDERRQAIEAIPAFLAHCKANPTYRPVHANRFLSQRRFEQLLATPSSDAPDPDLITLAADHPDFRAVERLRGRTIPVGNSGRVTFRKDEIEKARSMGETLL